MHDCVHAEDAGVRCQGEGEEGGKREGRRWEEGGEEVGRGRGGGGKREGREEEEGAKGCERAGGNRAEKMFVVCALWSQCYDMGVCLCLPRNV